MNDSDRRIGSRVDSNLVRESAAGIRYDSGPYLGVVKNNSDPTRSGRLQVWIPDLGAGDETDPNNWRTVSYASPFFGSTAQVVNNSGPRDNSFNSVKHTYGMWFTPPDLENFVLCTFVAGDPARGYWFACVPNQLGHHMVPAIAASTNVDTATIKDPVLKKIVTVGQAVPVAEFNEYSENVDWAQFPQAKKPVHEAQLRRLVTQGLDRVRLTGSRGMVFSTSQRETPSGVFGISTPGRALQVDNGVIRTRSGGHSLVMDDGDTGGVNNLVRLRTAAGHQLLMDDTDRVLYVSNSDGSCWIELTGSGHVNVYGADSINLRAGKNFNLHADGDVNINAGGGLNISAQQSVTVNSAAALNLTATAKATVHAGSVGIGSSGRIDINTSGAGSFTATQALMFTGKPIGLNSGPGPAVIKPQASPVFNLADVRVDGNGQWQVQHNAIKSVAKIVPTHEPWPRTEGVVSTASSGSSSAGSTVSGLSTGNDSAIGSSILGNTGSASGTSITSQSAPAANVAPIECNENTVTSSGGVVRDSSGNPVLTGSAANLDSGPRAAVGQSVSSPVPRNYLNRDDTPNPPGGIGPLSQLQVKALMTQLAYSESSFDYKRTNSLGFAGKYQFGAPALVDVGYIKLAAQRTYSGNSSLNYPTSWTGRDGVNSISEWLTNKTAQENAMFALLNKNYNFLTGSGGIKNGDDFCTVAGMLCVAHLLGATGAINWRRTGSGQDANQTSGTTYYNRGRYAIDVLARGR